VSADGPIVDTARCRAALSCADYIPMQHNVIGRAALDHAGPSLAHCEAPALEIATVEDRGMSFRANGLGRNGSAIGRSTPHLHHPCVK
jgi:hypothetical protein